MDDRLATGTGTEARADEAAHVLDRLERIEALDRARAPAGRLLVELRELVREAEEWARIDRGDRAPGTAGKLPGRQKE